MAFQGSGFLIVNDVLTDCAFGLIQPSVKTVVPGGGIAAGVRTVSAYDPSMYVGAQIVVGVIGTNIETVTITAVSVGASFTATFANNHSAGEPIAGATFPVRQTTDPLLTQPEMLQYLSTAVNDFLTDCPLAYAVNEAVVVPPTAASTSLPGDTLFPVRVANGSYPLRETTQSNLDSMNYRWNTQGLSAPSVFFRDKIPLQSVGIWPRAANTTTLEVVYAQRQTDGTMGLADGFLIPDPFLLYVLYKTLSYAFAKDGEIRNAGLAKYFQSRYEYGVKISKMLLDSIQDPNLEMA